jgi:predicted dehydrogenase
MDGGGLLEALTRKPFLAFSREKTMAVEALEPVLVLGCGSIGSRHIGNLRELGVRHIVAYDPDPARLRHVAEHYHAEALPNLEEAKKIRTAFICTPPSSHISLARWALDCGAHLFIEKPLSNTLEGVDELLERARTANRRIMIGFNLRYHPCLQQIKKLLEDKEIGRVLGARIQFGYYLPDWRPAQDYREGYGASRQLGGGIVLDRIHELDYARWFLGEVCEVTCVAAKLSSLEIETEDFVEILLRFTSGSMAALHLDYVQRTYNSTCQIIGEQGTILWDYNQRNVRCYSAATGTWREWPESRTFQINQTYMEEVRTFLEVLEGRCDPPVDGAEGRRILEIALKAKESAAAGRTIRL